MATADSPGTTNASSWKESISELKQLLQEGGGVSGKSTHSKISSCCHRILQSDATNIDDADGDTESEPPSPEIRSIITKIYLRSLIRLGKYNDVIKYCNDSKGGNGGSEGFVEEEAYALYRLRKYIQCRILCEKEIDSKDGGSGSARGLMHIYAQTLYRLGETRLADEAYRRLLSETSEGGSAEEEKYPEMDPDEREDTLSNALANQTANYTPGSFFSSYDAENSASTRCWLEEDDAIVSLLQSHGQASLSTNKEIDGDSEELQNYDLAYNLATFLLVSADARPRSSMVQAKSLLEQAEKSAITMHALEESGEDGDENVEGEESSEEAAKEKAKKQQQQQQMIEQEANPIRANLALSNLLLGGEENEMEALRTYLTLVTKAAKRTNANDSANNASGGGIHANLLATASNNLALLRDGKESVFDVLKRIPTTSYLSVSEEVSGKGSSGASMVPLVGATPQQVRTALYNRALALAKMGNVSGCLEALAVLRASLLVSYHGDVGVGGGGSGSSKSNSIGSPKRNAKKKKKASGSGAAGGEGATGATGTGCEDHDVPTAKPSSDVEAIAWKARADLIESELLRISTSSTSHLSSSNNSGDGKDVVPSDIPDKSSESVLKDAISKLEEPLKAKDEEAEGVLDYTKAQLLLHAAIVDSLSKSSKQSKSSTLQSLIEALESLPEPVSSCPGTIVTLASLYGSSSMIPNERAEHLLSSLGENISARLALAQFHLEKGRYDEAAQLLETILDEEDSTGSEENSNKQMQIMTATALLVKALSYTDPEKAEEYAERLPGCSDAMELDGEALESMEIPRFAKKVTGAGAGSSGGAGGTSKVRKMIASTGGKGRNVGERKKKNHEAILRKRAKKREEYLSHLQSIGRYNPDQNPLPKPDPERWIPKSQRSYNRRGRRGRYKSNVGAQGGGAGVGMEKEAAKLDVAARVAAAKSGDGGGSGAPSTANIKVSGSGTGRKSKGGRRR